MRGYEDCNPNPHLDMKKRYEERYQSIPFKEHVTLQGVHGGESGAIRLPGHDGSRNSRRLKSTEVRKVFPIYATFNSHTHAHKCVLIGGGKY